MVHFSWLTFIGEAVLYNVFYEIFTACTSIVGQDKNGMFSIESISILCKLESKVVQKKLLSIVVPSARSRHLVKKPLSLATVVSVEINCFQLALYVTKY